MQAQRANTTTAPWIEPTEPTRPAPQLAGSHMAGATSPALLLRDELAARLARLAELEMQGSGVAAREPKWPMPARLAFIVGFSVACWSAIGVAVAQLI